jgi:hypothetical protein
MLLSVVIEIQNGNPQAVANGDLGWLDPPNLVGSIANVIQALSTKARRGGCLAQPKG